jgi:hypothetical protein
VTISKAGIEQARELFGPAPILTSEEPERFENFFLQLASSIGPQDFTELLLIWQFACESWNVSRYTRHATVAIERRHREHLLFMVQRAKAEERRKQLREGGRTFANSEPKDIAALADLEEKFLSADDEVGEILECAASERNHNLALQRSVCFQDQLDKLINSATRRRDDALQQLELYRTGVGAQAKQLSQKIFEGEYAKSVPLRSNAPALPLSAEVETDDRE